MQNRRSKASGKPPLRLPIIAPKEDLFDAFAKSEKPLIAPPRIRLPPRSRTGCWTCRSRKVKCDEGHPQCNQCTRLGHTCDYRPRLAFRDDTPRIMGRMADVKTNGHVVWDHREKKAEAFSPGTYHVVMTPDSFSSLPEYADDVEKPKSNPECRRSATNSPTITAKADSPREDPNVVILKTFEDVTRRSPSSGKIRISPTSEISDPFCNLSLSPNFTSLPSPDVKVEESHMTFLDPRLDQQSQDSTIFSHFRHVVWRQLFPHDHRLDDSCGSDSHSHFMTLSMDFLEQEATRFPPLSHAMMAVSALSLSHSGTGHNVDALQYYQQAFPSLQVSLRNNDDLVSDGLFLTHFLLLIYEIAAAEPHGSNLWSHHISRLLHIAFLRRAKYGQEPHPFILWWVCHIDLYALFSGAGTGEFVRAIIDHQMLPGSECLLYPSAPEGYSVIYSDEHESLPVIMRLYHDTFRLAAQLGFLAARLRHDKQNLPFAEFDQRSQEVSDLRQAFGRLWESPDVAFLHQHQDNLPRRSREIMQQSATLYHVCQLFSYSSMWPGQRVESDFCPDGDIDHHATEILRLAERTTHTRRADRHFIVFPLFLAGATASASGLKMMAMELMTSMEDEEDGMGRNAATTRAILQIVYERQLERLMHVGHTFDVDWSDLMAQEGLQMVNFGF
ncbi:transcriptional regulator family: Fungal Specific TF [Penicillium coprophilum]|uniref:transcriptional regulator family: Fungal Specific TF n=1 Tax=Penicillium coprophilum TaxID=36646 RepID=UPI0023942C03|nr:transcriptional regulator family: Fungal Specific TF [Penicillium coprophilum]KAJ5162868.1 transcriptional regulator family: Fungal Specific TF [Penicillium coprophilum]